jgi:hypothetical protein
MAMRRRGSSQSRGESPPCDVGRLPAGRATLSRVNSEGTSLTPALFGGAWSYEQEARGEATARIRRYSTKQQLASAPSSAAATHTRHRRRGAATIASRGNRRRPKGINS